jgi:hypothetical protein
MTGSNGIIRRASDVGSVPFRAAILLAVGCTTHHHVTAAPTSSVVNGTKGAEITGEVTAGDDGLVAIAGATARAGHDINGLGDHLKTGQS